MSQDTDDYLKATKHPYPCLLFLLPLLAIYEGGVLWLGSGNVNRTGADTWLRDGMQQLGVPALHWPPIVIVLIFAFWSYRRWGDKPKDVLGVVMGMAVEAVMFAVILWGLGRVQGPLLEKMGVVLQAPSGNFANAPAADCGTPTPIPPPPPPPNERIAKAVSYVGAGIYEETLFRLVLFSLIVLAAGKALPALAVVPIAMLASAIAFAVAHHIGPHADPVENKVFVFRTVAGVYFCVLFVSRGFGVAAGAHACYDVLVGVAMS